MAKVLLAILCVTLIVARAAAQRDEIDEELVPMSETTVTTTSTTQTSGATLKTETMQPNTTIPTTEAPHTTASEATTASTEAPATTAASPKTTTLPERLQPINPTTTTLVQATTSPATNKPPTRNLKAQAAFKSQGGRKSNFRQSKSGSQFGAKKMNPDERFQVKGGSSRNNNYPFNNDLPNLLSAYGNPYNWLQLQRERYLHNLLFGGLFFDWFI